MPTFNPVEALSRLAALAAQSPDDERLQRALRWACSEIAGQPLQVAA